MNSVADYLVVWVHPPFHLEYWLCLDWGSMAGRVLVEGRASSTWGQCPLVGHLMLDYCYIPPPRRQQDRKSDQHVSECGSLADCNAQKSRWAGGILIIAMGALGTFGHVRRADDDAEFKKRRQSVLVLFGVQVGTCIVIRITTHNCPLVIARYCCHDHYEELSNQSAS